MIENSATKSTEPPGAIMAEWAPAKTRSLDTLSSCLLVVHGVTLVIYAALLPMNDALPFKDVLDPFLILISDACAALACYHTSRLSQGAIYASGWRCLAAANGAYVVGTLGWFFPTIAESARAGLSLVDVPYFLFYPFVLLGALRWPRRPEARVRGLSLWLDAAVAPIGAFMAVWFGLADATLRSLGTNAGGPAGSLIYPFADLILLFCVALLTRDPVDDFARIAGTCVAVSLFLTTLGDIGLALSLMGQEARGEIDWSDFVFVAASFVMTVGGAIFRFEARHNAPISARLRVVFARLPGLPFLVPATGAGVGFLFLVFDALSSRDLRGAGLVVGASLLLIIGLSRTTLAEMAAARNAAQLSSLLGDLRLSRGAAEAARETAEQALRAKSQFFAVMGHEIRTPLNAVIGMTDVLLTTPLSDSQRESAEVIRQGGDALLVVVNDLLDFSKMEAGRLEIESVALNPGRAIERIVLLMQGTAAARGLSIRASLHDLPAVAMGDEARLGQILLNLLSNAIKFSAKGTIEVRASSVDTGSGFQLTVAVSDRGIGIAPEKVPLLFQPFSQLSPGLTRGYGGSGLGLAISKRLAELMHGSIRVESVANEGSVFTFEIRLGRPTKLTTVPIPPLIPGLSQHRNEKGALKVLIVEDNLVNQQVLSSMVELLGHRAEVVSDGFAALQRVKDAPYDIVLTDLMMPEMDGLETARRLREIENGRGAFVVAVTAAARVEDRERCLAAGMDGFLAKPFTIEALRALFARFA